MNNLYRKNELTFALVWIALYVVLFSAADSLSETLGTAKLLTAPLCIAFVLLLWLWLGKNQLGEKYGLCRFSGTLRDYLYFLPLLLLVSVNLWNGVQLRYSAAETILYVVSMLCVGFIEEILFRGFLFQALLQDNARSAVLISSLTFGIGHIVNLLNGAEVFSTLLQICYASAIGFLFTILFYKGKSLIPCIAAHSLVNALSAFAVETPKEVGVLSALFLIAVSLGYALWIIRRPKM